MPFPLLILVLGLAGAMEIQVPEEPVVALFGQDATLLCSFSPEANFSVAELSLIWQLTDTKRLVHGFSGGRDLLQDQGRGYANRTALFYDQLALGNVSLLLRRVRIADEGSFTCFVRVRDYDSAALTLQVAAPYSKPSVHLEPSKDLKPGDVAVVTCHTSGGYPEASVLWQDGRGANLTANVTTWQVANEEGLFEVRSVLRVLLEPGVTYSCLVLNTALRQHGHASVTITGQPQAFPAVALWVTVALAVCVVALLAVLAFVCHQKVRESCREDAAVAGESREGLGGTAGTGGGTAGTGGGTATPVPFISGILSLLPLPFFGAAFHIFMGWCLTRVAFVPQKAPRTPPPPSGMNFFPWILFPVSLGNDIFSHSFFPWILLLVSQELPFFHFFSMGFAPSFYWKLLFFHGFFSMNLASSFPQE
uniref:CD276 molecule n=1 Tax=Taeniopygia guttata TaxID=59729 RepID=A0A674G8E6_TAEGU